MLALLAALQVQLVGMDDVRIRNRAIEAFHHEGFVVTRTAPVKAFVGVGRGTSGPEALVIVFAESPFQLLGEAVTGGGDLESSIRLAVRRMRVDVSENAMMQEPEWFGWVGRRQGVPDEIEGVWVGGRAYDYAAVFLLVRTGSEDDELIHHLTAVRSTSRLNLGLLCAFGAERGRWYRNGADVRTRVVREEGRLRIRQSRFVRVAGLPERVRELSTKKVSSPRRIGAAQILVPPIDKSPPPRFYITQGVDAFDSLGELEVAVRQPLGKRWGLSARYANDTRNQHAGLYVDWRFAPLWRLTAGPVYMQGYWAQRWRLLPGVEVSYGDDSFEIYASYLASTGSGANHFEGGIRIAMTKNPLLAVRVSYGIRPWVGDVGGTYGFEAAMGKRVKFVIGARLLAPTMAYGGIRIDY